MAERIQAIDVDMSAEDFWNDNVRAQKLLKEQKYLKVKLEQVDGIENAIDDCEMTCELAIDEDDSSFEKDVIKALSTITESLEAMRLETLLSGEFDTHNAIVQIHAGTGGLDAQDWTEMLLRMYKRWMDKKEYSVETLDIIRDTEAGIKSVTLRVAGMYAFGFLKSEKGVHRLVRISPFDSSGKRHTSFASVDVMPELDDDMDVDIDQNDLKIDTYRASGAGGQHVNKTDSAIRITHIPTGIVVQCQNQRSQLSNKNTALKMLMGKLTELKILENKERIEDIQGDYSQIAWGSQIRSYVFNPYTLVKDHRTNAEIGNIQSVMDGDIDLFINAYLNQ